MYFITVSVLGCINCKGYSYPLRF